ncbi:hypothetical protein [Lacticaseibacillus absianus]|uniref:hypothetical protein n=1 Tax=Lacticaseibacillus absianus TaxID=2729623 RepID=UPI0015C7DEBD|nr:hypothetical protein [Lacticaseibacillus absianus]
MDDQYYDFVRDYENRDVTMTLKSGEKLTGYVEVTYPADDDDTGRVSFSLGTNPGMRNVYLDDIETIALT